MIVLTYEHEDQTIVFTVPAGQVEDVLDAVKRFLLAIGYADYGQLVFKKGGDNAV